MFLYTSIVAYHALFVNSFFAPFLLEFSTELFIFDWRTRFLPKNRSSLLGIS